MTASIPLTRAILIETRQGSKRVEGIPANAKITYGPVNPGGKYHDGTNVLRIYNNVSNQLAVFTGVIEFRDLSLRMLEKETVTDEDRTMVNGPGYGSDAISSETTTKWVEVA